MAYKTLLVKDYQESVINPIPNKVVIRLCFKIRFGCSVALDLKPFCLKQQIKVHTKSSRQI